MSLGSIIGRLLGKSKANSESQSGWGGWLDTKEGINWEAIGQSVYDELNEAKVNVHSRRIILENGTNFTTTEIAVQIADKIQQDVRDVHEHIIEWLVEAADSDDEDRDDDFDTDLLMKRWVENSRKSIDRHR